MQSSAAEEDSLARSRTGTYQELSSNTHRAKKSSQVALVRNPQAELCAQDPFTTLLTTLQQQQHWLQLVLHSEPTLFFFCVCVWLVFIFGFLFFQTRELSGQRIWALALERRRSLGLPSSYGVERVTFWRPPQKYWICIQFILRQPEGIKFIPAFKWTMQERIASAHHREFDIYLVRRKRIQAPLQKIICKFHKRSPWWGCYFYLSSLPN